ncbi:MAG: glucose 1-dehydrogenase [Rhodospirillaceae bacterium]|jgi:NAD(P)-dependent dehydrogenase (short-subunit alcohol dehydrogenase family)|nr:glucose 1-dehydrogenase [Rhodospirillaceae bacterium]MBT4691490.1 glucose 1-dehydrogenase [Rhodospirillaceae bacterium]MBT5082993.1 glucose 1-dehydrogenase [Rhodospirillaceae bacterium]MBT5524437.1 glucose 1-dehydrogenase [Rhodospirillaceae bacterium]MBT5878767.1 glucose 1-dehydrogenase [Rhodospirillaceae bacterium]
MSREIFDLTGRVALITGSTMGLGRATAQVLAEHGAHVVISSRKQDACDEVAAEFRELGLSAEGRACHIGNEDTVAAMYAHLGERHGRLDILINNAVLSPWRTILDTDHGLVKKALDVNIGGYWQMSVGAVELMRKNSPNIGGSIINISSTAARHASPNLALYSTFKAALDGMTRSFALEFGPDQIRVNTILPGLFETSLADAYTPEVKAKMLAQTPLGRLGDPVEVGYAVLYLASDAARYTTGTSLVIDGGRTVSIG